MPEDFEEELPEVDEVEPEAEKRSKAIIRLARNDRAGYMALTEEFQNRAKNAFMELSSVSPTDVKVPTLLSRFQALNETVIALKSFGS